MYFFYKLINNKHDMKITIKAIYISAYICINECVCKQDRFKFIKCYVVLDGLY